MRTLIDWIIAAVIAVLFSLVPMIGHAAEAQESSKEFCETVAVDAHIAAQARNEGASLGEFEYVIFAQAYSNNSERTLLYKMARIVYTAEDFANLTSDAAADYAYHACISVK